MTNNFIKSVALISCFCFLLGGFGHQALAKAAKTKPTKAANAATSSSSSAATNTLAYAQCLKDKGITMYGTSWCTHCNHQKEIFGDYFSYVKFVDCDKNSELCDAKGVRGYPTWLLPNGQEVNAGSVEAVAKASGCVLASAPSAESTTSNKPAPVASKEPSAAPSASANEAYAKCIQEKGVKMYGLSHCPHCKAQKKEFGELFKYVTYVECDTPTERCSEAKKKGKGYPTWLTPDGSKIEPGSIEEVAIDAGCTLDANKPTPAKNTSGSSSEASTQDLLKDLDNVQSPYKK